MLKGLKGTLGRKRTSMFGHSSGGHEHRGSGEEGHERMPRPSMGGNDLVIQTKEFSLNGVAAGKGFTGTAITGSGAAWTKSFNLQGNHQKFTPPVVERNTSADSLGLDEDLFLPPDGLPEEAPADTEADEDQARRLKDLADFYDKVHLRTPEEVEVPEEMRDAVKPLLHAIEQHPPLRKTTPDPEPRRSPMEVIEETDDEDEYAEDDGE